MTVRTGPPRPRRPFFSEIVAPDDPAPLAARLAVARQAAEAEVEKLRLDAGGPAPSGRRHGLPFRILVSPWPLGAPMEQRIAADVTVCAAACMVKLR
jgi:hypothetical protein